MRAPAALPLMAALAVFAGCEPKPPPPRPLPRGLDTDPIAPSLEPGLPPGALRRLGPPPGPLAWPGATFRWLDRHRLLVVDVPQRWGDCPHPPFGPAEDEYESAAVRVWDMNQRTLRWRLPTDTRTAAFAPVRGWLGSEDKEYTIWDPHGPRVLWRRAMGAVAQFTSRRLLLSRDGTRVVVAEAGRRVSWYALPSGEKRGTIDLSHLGQWVALVGLSPSGRYLAVRPGRVGHHLPPPRYEAEELWDLETGRRVPGLEAARKEWRIVGMTPGEAWVVMDSDRWDEKAGRRRFVDTATGLGIRLLDKSEVDRHLDAHPALGVVVRWDDPDVSDLDSAPSTSREGRPVEVVSLATGKRLWAGARRAKGPVIAHTAERMLHVSATGAVQAVALRTGDTVWSWKASAPVQTLKVLADERFVLVITASSRRLLAVSDGKAHPLPATLASPNGPPHLHLFPGHGTLLAQPDPAAPRNAQDDRVSQVQRYSWPAGARLDAGPPTPGFPVADLWWGYGEAIRLQDGRTDAWRAWWPRSQRLTAASSPAPVAGEYFQWLTPDGRVQAREWDTSAVWLRSRGGRHEGIALRCVSPKGRGAFPCTIRAMALSPIAPLQVALTTEGRLDEDEQGGTPGVFRLVDVRRNRWRTLWRANFVCGPAFSPDGRLVAVAGRPSENASAHEVRVFDAFSGKERARETLPASCRRLGIDGTGRLLTVLDVGPDAGTLYQVSPLRRLLALDAGFRGGFAPGLVRFSPGRRLLVTSHPGGTLTLWRVPP